MRRITGGASDPPAIARQMSWEETRMKLMQRAAFGLLALLTAGLAHAVPSPSPSPASLARSPCSALSTRSGAPSPPGRYFPAATLSNPPRPTATPRPAAARTRPPWAACRSRLAAMSSRPTCSTSALATISPAAISTPCSRRTSPGRIFSISA